jgi:hypothetical protein
MLSNDCNDQLVIAARASVGLLFSQGMSMKGKAQKGFTSRAPHIVGYIYTSTYECTQCMNLSGASDFCLHEGVVVSPSVVLQHTS